MTYHLILESRKGKVKSVPEQRLKAHSQSSWSLSRKDGEDRKIKGDSAQRVVCMGDRIWLGRERVVGIEGHGEG